MRKHFRTLSFRFLLSSSIIFLLFTGIILNIWYYVLKKEAEQTAVNNMTHITKISNNIFNSQVNDMLNVISLLSVRTGDYNSNIINILTDSDLTDSELLNYKRTAADYLIKLCSNKDYLNGMYISDLENRKISYGVATPYEELLQGQSLSSFSPTSRGFYFFPPHINQSYSQKNLVFSIVRPIYTPADRFCGVIVADIKCSLFDDIFSDNANWSDNFYLYDSQRANFIYNFKNPVDSGQYTDNAIAEQLLEYKNNDNFSTLFNGQKTIVVMDHSEISGWTSVILSYEEDIIPGFLRSRTLILFITSAFFLLTLLLNGVLTYFMTRDIRALTAAAGKINETNLNLPVLSASSEETESLYKNFQAMLQRIRELIANNRIKEQEKHKAELRTLQAQINPHFLYNTLNTIKFLAILNGNENIQKVSESLTSLLHVNMSPEIFISVGQEKTYLENYLELQSYSYTNQFHYIITVNPEVQNYFLPKMLIQPLVENCLKHGFKDRLLHNELNISFTLNDGGYLQICIKDNGLGIPDEILTTLKGLHPSDNHIGLGNVRQRLELYFESNYRFHIQSVSDEYTLQRIEMPLILENEVIDYV